MRPLGAYIRSYGLVLWSAGGVFLWLVGCCMAAESLSGSWSAQVPERPTAVGSRLVYPRGCRGVDPCGASRPKTQCRRIGRIDASLRPFAWFCFAGGSAADRPPGVHIRPLGSVLWPGGGACAPIGGVYPSTGGVYPASGVGFVAWWGCMCAH